MPAKEKANRESLLQTEKIMSHRGVNTMDVSQATGNAYNTVLSYRRDNSQYLSRQVLQDLAGALRVEVWELFYPGELAKPLTKIAKAIGIEATEPVTFDEYKGLIMAISAKCGAGVTEADFAPQAPPATKSD